MSLTAKWTTAILSLVWLLAPGPTGTPLAGIPFTDPCVFVFVWAWVFLFWVLPARSDRRVWPWAAAIVALIALKLFAGALASPRGLTGTYQCLVGSKTGERAPGGPRPWRRIDPELHFDDNSLGLTGRTWHLLFYDSRPFWNYPKPALEQAVEPGREHECLDLAGLSVTWRGWIDANPGRYTFRADTDGEWEVAVERESGEWTRWSSRDPKRPSFPERIHLGPKPQRIVVRYVREPTDASARRDQRMRFRLFWSGPQTEEDGQVSDEPVPGRVLRPDSSRRPPPTAYFGEEFAVDAVAWLSLAGMGLFSLAWLLRMTDWRRVRAEFPHPRLIVFALALGTFIHGWVRIAKAEARDPQASTLNTYDYKTYLARALAYQHDGDFVPGTAARSSLPAGDPMGRSSLPAGDPMGRASLPAGDPVGRASLPAAEPLNPWLQTLAGALDGRLGPIKYVADEPDTPANRLHAFYRNPLMDYYLAGLLEVFGERLGLCYLFQALTASAAVALTYLIGRICFGKWAGLPAAGAVAVDPHFIRFAEFFYAEQPAGLLVPAALAAVMLARRTANFAWFATAGLALATAFLMRPNLALLLPVAVLWFLLPGRRAGGAAIGRRAIGAGVTVLVFSLCWSLLPVRNWQLSGRALWGVTSGPTVLIVASQIPRDRPLDRYIEEADPADRAKLRERLEVVHALSFDAGDGRPAYGDPLPYDAYPEINPVLERIAWDYIRENPARMAGVWAGRLWEIWGAGQKWHPLVYLAAMIAAVPLLLRRRGPEPLLPAAALAVMTLTLTIFFFEERHRTPCLPLVHVFTGAVLTAGLRRLRTTIRICSDPCGMLMRE